MFNKPSANGLGSWVQKDWISNGSCRTTIHGNPIHTIAVQIKVILKITTITQVDIKSLGVYNTHIGNNTQESMMSEWIPPQLGTVDASLMITDEPTVQVRVYKFDTIRQQAYWTTKTVRKFKTREQAEEYVARVIDTQKI